MMLTPKKIFLSYFNIRTAYLKPCYNEVYRQIIKFKMRYKALI